MLRVTDPRLAEVEALLREHHEFVMQHSPTESVHALDVEGLCARDVTFWGAWDGEVLVGCGGLRELDATHGEIKSMRTTAAQQRRGIGGAVLEHIVRVAEERGYRRLSLETGSAEAFRPAWSLYSRFGFEECGPFGKYVEDPYSRFMTRVLAASR